MPSQNVDAQIRSLEERLLAPESRSSAESLDSLLASDFVEFGSSGRTFDKADVIRYLEKEAPIQAVIDEFSVTELGPDAMLARYRITVGGAEAGPAESGSRTSLRSSIWVRRDGRWQVLFHQGTSIPK